MSNDERPFVRSLCDDIEAVLCHRYNAKCDVDCGPFPEGYLWTNKLLISDLEILLKQLDGCITCEEDFEGEADDLALFYMATAHAIAMTPVDAA